MSTEELIERLAASLPDSQRWVETRAMLLRGACDVSGQEEKPIPSYVARDRETGVVAVMGEPKAKAIQEAVRGNPPTHEVICQFESGPCVTRALPDWQGTSVLLHRMGRASLLPEVPEGAVRELSRAEVAALENLPSELRSELIIGAQRAPVVAAVGADGSLVSFCCSWSVTERLWDVGVETLEAFRRQGFAGLCVSYMTALMREQGKEPVWGALDTNEASLQLAEKLGFAAVDRVLVFAPEGD